MVAAATSIRRNRDKRKQDRFVYHPSFEDARAEIIYGFDDEPREAWELGDRHMPDDRTREFARRMHYAAYRMNIASNVSARSRWGDRYRLLRDRIILGNRKLIFRAVHKWKSASYQFDDLIGECHLVLMRVVVCYNPWLGIRFSTYAFTCLMRALSRLWAKISAEQKRRLLFPVLLADLDVVESREPPSQSQSLPVEMFFRDDHRLLSEREKLVLKRRYGLCSPPVQSTLEAVGRDLGLSKERVRQVEKAALGKLRLALSDGRNAIT